MKNEHAIVCIHGLWMRKAIYWYIRNALRRTGSEFYLFNYASIRKPVTSHAITLQRYVENIEAKRVDFIAHSLGGLLLFQYFVNANDERLNKTVLMGTPLHGSAIAKACNSTIFKPFLGVNQEILQHGISRWTAPGPVMMIAGNKSIGMGSIFRNTLAAENDGTVTVAETKDENLYAHHVINASHSSMLYSSQAVQLIRSFIH